MCRSYRKQRSFCPPPRSRPWRRLVIVARLRNDVARVVVRVASLTVRDGFRACCSAIRRRELRRRLADRAVVARGAADQRRAAGLLRSPGAGRVSVHVVGRAQRRRRQPVGGARSCRRTALAADVPSTLSRLTRYAAATLYISTLTTALQPVVTRRQSPYLRPLPSATKPAIIIVTSFSLSRYSRD